MEPSLPPHFWFNIRGYAWLVGLSHWVLRNFADQRVMISRHPPSNNYSLVCNLAVHIKIISVYIRTLEYPHLLCLNGSVERAFNTVCVINGLVAFYGLVESLYITHFSGVYVEMLYHISNFSIIFLESQWMKTN